MTPNKRLSQSELSKYRAQVLADQGGRCQLCGEIIPAGEAVFDHDHKTGHCRAVLHRGCNAMLGHIENNRPRHSLMGGRLDRMLKAVFTYIHANYSDRPLYPTFRNEDEKRELKNMRARKARAKKKAT
jgi:hypothetical protein